MSTAPSPRRHNDENSLPFKPYHRRDATLGSLAAPSPSPRPRQPLAQVDVPNNPPANLFSSAAASSRYPPATPASSASAAPADATPVRAPATKVDPDARELPLPKGLAFAAPPPPASALLPLPTPHRTPSHQTARHHNPPPLHHAGHHTPHLPTPHSVQQQQQQQQYGHAQLPLQSPRYGHHAPSVHHLQSTPSARSMSLSYSSPSTVSHMPSTPDMHNRSPYPPGPIDLHELLPPQRFPGPLPAAYLNQGEMPSSDNANGNDNDDNSSTAARRTLVSCNPWDYRPEDHGKNKPRRRFSPGELDMLEILWSISHNPHKWQRQKLARWFGCTTRHLTVWFQNRRQDLKKAEMLLQVADNDPDAASKALAAVNRANRGNETKFTIEQSGVIMDIVSDRLLPDMWFAQQPSGSSPTGVHATPSPPALGSSLPGDRVAYSSMTAPTPTHPGHHAPGAIYALKPVRRGYSLDDVCADREQSMTHRPSQRPRHRVEDFDQLHKNDPRYREALLNMLPSELSSDVIEPPEDEEDSVGDEDSPTRKRARYAAAARAPRPTLPSIGLGRPPAGFGGHRARSSFGRASSSDVLACSSRARYLANNNGLGSSVPGMLSMRAVTDPVPSRSTSAGGRPAPPPAPEHIARPPSAQSMSAATDKKRKLSRQGSWSHLPSLKHRDSFDRSRSVTEVPIEERSSPVPDATRSPTPTDADSSSPKTATTDPASGPNSVKDGPSAASTAPLAPKPRLPIPRGRSIYSFSTELEPEAKRGTPEMDENVLTGAHALMELFRGR
ncbi:hypothetical protein Q8F55_002412 [Vanrija albida]|uniref:Homeobox domain-containing protein n=1 Tax=Vanrija albida TaxID=181172 RepID=A0ABR3Q9V5_9TREE